jgi:hypothetical protein
MAKRLQRLSLTTGPESDSEDEEEGVLRAPSTTPSTSLPELEEVGHGQLLERTSTSDEDDDLFFAVNESDEEDRTTPTPPPSMEKTSDVNEQLEKLMKNAGFSSLTFQQGKENK